MNITYVSNTDLPGRIFNGYDLHRSMNNFGHFCNQIVIDRKSDTDTVIPLLNENEHFVRNTLINLERELSVNNLLFPYKDYLVENKYFRKADIIHYQLIHNAVLSMFDIDQLFHLKRSVWTIHDPWIFTGHCVHPIDCTKWTNGCGGCPNLDDDAFPMISDRSNQMWKIKKEALKKGNVDLIVSTDFMVDYIKNSPITSQLKRVHKIPFGINLKTTKLREKSEAKYSLGIDNSDIVIAFRAENNKLKGLSFIIESLEMLEIKRPVSILTVGYQPVPSCIKSKYNTIELGWRNDLEMMSRFYNAADIFLMPSLAESFGLMAIEAMAYECPVIVFENTVLPEITFAPQCGIAVKYKDSKALKDAIEHLINNPDERLYRGELGRKIVERNYKYSDYVKKHIELYETIMKRD